MDEHNLMFPGRANYSGPIHGVFGALHHARLIESDDGGREGVISRVQYVLHCKAPSERATRLWNMIYLGNCEAAVKFITVVNARISWDLDQARIYYDACAGVRRQLVANLKPTQSPWSRRLEEKVATARKPLTVAYNARVAKRTERDNLTKEALTLQVLEYIHRYIPDFPWDGKKLIFPQQIPADGLVK